MLLSNVQRVIAKSKTFLMLYFKGFFIYVRCMLGGWGGCLIEGGELLPSWLKFEWKVLET